MHHFRLPRRDEEMAHFQFCHAKAQQNPGADSAPGLCMVRPRSMNGRLSHLWARRSTRPYRQSGSTTFAHSGNLRGAGFSRSASFWCPPFNDFPNPLRPRGTWLQFPTRLVDLLSGLYPYLPRLSIGLLQKSWKFSAGVYFSRL